MVRTNASRRTWYAAQAPSRWPEYMRPVSPQVIDYPLAVYGDAAGASGAAGLPWQEIGEAAGAIIPGIFANISLGGKRRKEAEAQVAQLQQQLMMQQQQQPAAADNTVLYIALGVLGLAVVGGGLYLASRR